MTNLYLFLACVVIWGSTWIAITFQLHTVPPEASVFYRFLFASFLLFIYCLVRRLRLRFALREHVWIAFFGIFMFSIQYLFVYYAEKYVVSGLVAVGYSAIPLLSMLGLRLFFGTSMTLRIGAGGLLGVAGIVLVFLPAFVSLRASGSPLIGALLTAIGVLAATGANLIAHRNNEAKLPLWQTMAWAMFYGAMFSLCVVLITDKALVFETTPAYIGSLLYLSIFGSILTFAAYLTLLARIGAARAGYIGVMVPVVALIISAAFEGYHWQVPTWIGIVVAVLGNVVILNERRKSML